LWPELVLVFGLKCVIGLISNSFSAYEEYIAAYEWYELQKEGLGKSLMTNVENVLKLISAHPEFFNKRKGNFRLTKVKGFPYAVVFEFFKLKEVIHIAAVYHGRRNPARKFRKIIR
jgi:plasmid stabilization system protein ParE